MSSIISAVAGPDVDMAELEGSPLIGGSVDLDLNLIPPVSEPDGLALGLDLGLGLGQENPAAAHDLAQVYRHNWPRFEPDISGLIPAGTLDSEPSFGSSDPLHQPSTSAFPSSASSFHSLEQLGSFILQDMHAPDPVLPPESVEAQSTPPHSITNDRFGRISQNPVGPPPPRLHFLDNEEFTPSLIPMDRRMDSDTPRGCLHNKPKESSPNCNAQENDNNIDENSPHANFDCNICLDLAKEPVVTICGHLFCWPCLYQWLHVHSHHDECPVCKGYVPDDAIIPLYGRGNNKDTHKTSGEQHSGEIPSRPHARRVNSLQRRGSGVSFFRGVDISSRDDRTEGQIDNGRQRGQLNSGVSRSAEQILHRLRIAQRLQREQLEQRIMARHRLLLSSSSIEPRMGIPVSVRDSQTQRTGGVEVQQRDHRERFLSQMTMNRFQRAERLAVIRARLVAGMDGLWESLQTSIPESGSSPPVRASTYTGVGRQGPVTSQYLQELAEPVVDGEERSTSTSVFSDFLNRNEQPDPLVSPLSQQRMRREAFEGGSSSADAEPGLMHTRKRRRLN